MKSAYENVCEKRFISHAIKPVINIVVGSTDERIHRAVMKGRLYCRMASSWSHVYRSAQHTSNVSGRDKTLNS